MSKLTDMIDSGIDKIEKANAWISKKIKKLAKFIRFFTTQVGFIVGLVILALFVIIIVAVFLKSAGHFWGMVTDPEYAGISTEGDYKYIVSSIGYAGYDSFITEKLWQEYMAYEYSVLMDVAEYLYQGQSEFDGKNQKGVSPKYLPYLPVKAEYDLSAMTHENWQKAVIEGQASARFGFTNVGDVGLGGSNGAGYEKLGGNTKVVSPVITYEFKTNPYDEGAGSLVPYVTVLKEALEYHYFTVGATGENGGREKYGTGEYSKNTENTGVTITEANIGDINLLEINNPLNINNLYLPKSSELGNKYIENSIESLNTESKDNWLVADSTFGQSLYYTNDYASVTYKMPLQTLVDRYLPKASVLTSWYLLKDTDAASDEMKGTTSNDGSTNQGQNDSSAFKVEDLMKDIKSIYNYHCWGKETISKENVDILQYNEDGTVKRDDEEKAIYEKGEKNYASTDNDTFIKFGQVGLETNRYGVFEFYDPKALGAAGPKCEDLSVTNAPDEATIPIVTNLFSDDAHFLETFELDIDFSFDYKYYYSVPGSRKSEFFTSQDYSSRVKVDESAGKVTIDGKRYTLDSSAPQNPQRIQGGYVVYYISGGGDNSKPGTSTGDFNAEYLKGDVSSGTLSGAIHDDAIKKAETDIQNNTAVQNAQKYAQGVGEEQLVNNEYLFPLMTSTNNTNSVTAKPLDYIAEYDHNIAFYNFTVTEGVMSADQLKSELSATILKAVKEQGEQDGTNLNKILEELAWGYAEEIAEAAEDTKTQLRPSGVPSSAKVTKIEVTDVTITVNGYSENPYYKAVSEYGAPQNAVYDIKEETIALKMDIPQKRVAAMLVTEVETWAKSATYDNDITQNSFDCDDYRYVIPHSFFGFGLRYFNINENPTYRVNMYDKYFSSPEKNKEAAIKEADVLAMLMKWEEYGNAGNETAYASMRDLYKLIMYIKENDGILDTAYSYLYLPDSIWDFREGITQEAWWTERLASDLYGDDALTIEDQKRIIVRKNEMSWQIVDYEEYDECKNGDVSRAYALFPFGSSFTRAYYMENAIEKGKFIDGNYKDGHAGADWYSRRHIKEIIKDGQSGNPTIYGNIYDYELKRRTLQNIMQEDGFGSALINKAISFLDGGDTTSVSYQKAKADLDEDLNQEKLYGPIVSVAAGVVTKASYNCYGGFSVHVMHTSGDGVTKIETSYAHMRRWPEVQVGDIVGPGTILRI